MQQDSRFTLSNTRAKLVTRTQIAEHGLRDERLHLVCSSGEPPCLVLMSGPSSAVRECVAFAFSFSMSLSPSPLFLPARFLFHLGGVCEHNLFSCRLDVSIVLKIVSC